MTDQDDGEREAGFRYITLDTVSATKKDKTDQEMRATISECVSQGCPLLGCEFESRPEGMRKGGRWIRGNSDARP